VSGLTHNFYKYPARFSPLFTRAAIQVFTKPREIVYDPFMGGATTIVEATALGRRAIGTDINSLAIFLGRVKTRPMPSTYLVNVQRWAERLIPQLRLSTRAPRATSWAELGYQINVNNRETWRIRKLLDVALAELQELRTVAEQEFGRCILLRTAQWAFDCRAEVPSVDEFRISFLQNCNDMVCSAGEYADAIASLPESVRASVKKPILLHRSAVGIEKQRAVALCQPISLVVTSPPYPGVHVLYHRWQVQGRRETAAPYWIANSFDGNGTSFYTFGDRHEKQLKSYFKQALAAFESLAKIVTRRTMIVQMVAFTHPEWQLPRYIQTMEKAGFEEVSFPELANRADGRVWREVPNRKWYATKRGPTSSSNEVVLFHRLCR
jgi:hypothetical protein